MTLFHHIGNALRELLMKLPLWSVRAVFLLVFIMLIIWVLTLPKHATVAPNSEHKPGHNLKLWATLALLIQVIVYSVL